jgi:hypothetical protein
MPETAAPITAEARWFLHDRVTILLRGEQDEGFYVLEGELTLFVAGGEARRLRAGDFALAPRGVPHAYRAGEDGARALVQSSPSGFEAFVESMSRPAEGPGLPELAGPPSPEQAAHLAAVAADHGIDILGPLGTRP